MLGCLWFCLFDGSGQEKVDAVITDQHEICVRVIQVLKRLGEDEQVYYRNLRYGLLESAVKRVSLAQVAQERLYSELTTEDPRCS